MAMKKITHLFSVTIHFADGSPMVNSHCTLVPSTTNSFYSESSHHDNILATQLASHIVQDSSNNEGGIVENLVTLSPSESIVHEHSCKSFANNIRANSNTHRIQLMHIVSLYSS